MHATRLALSLLLASSPSFAQALVRDINQESAVAESDSSPELLATLGGVSFFSADDGLHGRELLVSDGTVSGTTVIDVSPGFVGSEPEDAVVFGDRLVFTAMAPGSDRNVWISDGTPAGTYSLTEFLPGFHTWHFPFEEEPVSVAGDRIYFIDKQISSQEVLCVSDGTARGTQSLGVAVDGLVGVGGGLQFFTAPGGLWRSDGTVGGTYAVGSGFAHAVGEALGLFFYGASDVLWRSDGTPAGTFPLPDPSLAGGGPWPFALGIVELGGWAYFKGFHPDFGQELWKTDGGAGSSLAFDLAPGPAFGLGESEVQLIGGVLYFVGNADVPFASDGTLAGTQQLVDAEVSDVFWALGDGRAAFMTPGGTFLPSKSVWATDGTPEGTEELVTNYGFGFAPLIGSSFLYFDYNHNDLWKVDGTGPETLVATNTVFSQSLQGGPGVVWYTDNVGNGLELWRSDATPAGTFEIDVNQNRVTHGSDASDLAGLGDRVFFAADDGEDRELWVSDGTELGTFEIDVWPGPESSDPRDLLVWNGRVYFGAEDPVSDRTELFVTDGTPGGTFTAVNKAYHDGSLVATDTGLYFLSGWGQGPFELWTTDGSTSQQVAGILDPKELTAFGDRLLFTSSDAGSSKHPWITDGTQAGTFELLDSPVFRMANIGDGAVLSASGSSTLYFTDGTPEGTSAYVSLPSGANLVPVSIGEVALLSIGDGVWRTDGTASGTFEVLPLPSEATVVWPGTRAGDHLYFWIDGPDAGPVLWRTDGTVAGTAPIEHPEVLQPTESHLGQYWGDPGATGSGTAIAVQLGDATYGREIWIHNPDDTFMLPELVPGNAGAPSSQFTHAGDHVFFVSDAGGVGDELFAFPFSEAGAWVAEAYGPGCGSAQVIQLRLDGVPEPAAAASLEVAYAPPSAPVAIQYALTKLALPLGQGCEWQLGLPFWSLPLGVADASGSYSLPLVWPSEPIFIGLPLYFQALVADAGIAWLGGWALTNGLEVRGAP